MNSLSSAPPGPSVMVKRLQALGEETRLEIVLRLAGGECCVCDLQEELGAAQSRLSFHLKKLKEAGILEDRKEGRWVYYTLVPDALREIREFLGGLEKGDRTEASMGDGGCCLPRRNN